MSAAITGDAMSANAPTIIAIVLTLVGCDGRESRSVGVETRLTQAAGTPRATPKSAEQPVRLGITAPYTGALARTSSEFHRGAWAFFSDVNERGGVLGRKIELVARDDEGSPTRAHQNVAALLGEDRVFALLGGAFGESSAGVTDALLAHRDGASASIGGAFGFAPLAAPDDVRSGRAASAWFHLVASRRDEAERIADAIAEAGIARILLVRSADAGGEEAAASLRPLLAARKIETAADLQHRRGVGLAETVRPALPLLREARPTALLVFADPEATSALVREVRDRGITAPVITFSTSGDAALAAVATRQTGDGPVLTALTLPHSEESSLPLIAEFREAMDRRHPAVPARLREGTGGSPPYAANALYGYFAAKVFTEVLQRAGANLTRATFRAAAERMTDYDPGLGGVRVSFNRHRERAGLRVWFAGAKRGFSGAVTDPSRFLRSVAPTRGTGGRPPGADASTSPIVRTF